MIKKTDDELLQLIKYQDKAAFETLFSRYEKPLYTYIYNITSRRELAEELLQETLPNHFKALSCKRARF